MKKKNINIIKVIIGIAIIIYVLFSSDILSEFRNMKASVSDVNDTYETERKLDVNGNLQIYFIDVGQADSIFITNGSNNMLIDAGNNADGKKLVTYFNELGVKKFDYVIGTHPHEDHIGGMDDIINNFKINKYMMPEKLSTSKTFEDVLDALASNELSYYVPKENDTFKLGEDTLIDIIYCGTDSNDTNDASIVLKLTYGENSFLFTGDATSSVEKQIINKNIKSDVLKIAHHGSDYSSKEEFLDRVNPKYAVISVGSDNKYKHPSDKTLDKLAIRNINIYRTDLSGTIIFTSDGKNINIETIKTDTNG